jgi:hypothetical protein
MSEPIEVIRQKYLALHGFLNEHTRRRWAATEARALGRGGIAKVSHATGINPSTIRAGLMELAQPTPSLPPPEPSNSAADVGAKSGSRAATFRIRAPGGGRKPVTATDPTLLTDLDTLIDPAPHERDTAPLRWTCKSTRELARALAALGHRVSQQKVAELLRDLGYSLRAPHIRLGGPDHPDCTLQFRYLCAAIQNAHAAGQPAIAISCNTGPPASGSPSGRTNRDPGDDPSGKPMPHAAFASEAGAGTETATDLPMLVGEAVRLWWGTMGRITYPEAAQLLITATWGGNLRTRLQWQLEFQALANATGLIVRVRHLPPGTRKWNGIEHCLTSHITQDWPGQARAIREVTVNLLSPSRPPDPRQKVLRAPAPARRTLSLTPDDFFGDWNYDIAPAEPGLIP